MQKLLFKFLIAVILSAFQVSLPHPSAAQSGTFMEMHPISCGDTMVIGSLGYPTWSIPQILDRPGNGHAILLGDFIEPNILQYVAPPCFSGRDTVVIECAHATQITCDTGIYIFEIACPEVLDPVYPIEIACNDSIYVDNLLAWWFPEILQGPANGFAEVILEPADGAGVFYRPNPGFEGLDIVKVRLINSQDTLLYLFQVYCEQLVSGWLEPEIFEELQVSPNPAGDFVRFSHVGNVSHIRLIDVQGRVIPVDFDQSGNEFRLYTANLQPGIYFVLVENNQRRMVGKFIRARA